MSGRRRDEDDAQPFEPEFDDDVFVEPDSDPQPAKPRKPRASRAKKAAVPPRKGRRALRIAGAGALAVALAAFVVSFVAGLGGGDDRVVGDAAEAAAELDRIGPRVRIEVLNAGGVAGRARLATEHLRDRGFDVVAFGNAGDFEQSTTVVIARTADVDAARRVARALGTDSVVVEPDPQLFVDATVRLGTDWPPAVDAAAAPGVGERVRGWFR